MKTKILNFFFEPEMIVSSEREDPIRISFLYCKSGSARQW